MLVGNFLFKLTANTKLLASNCKIKCRLIISVHGLRDSVDSKFNTFSFLSSVIGLFFACVCKVQLRLCVNHLQTEFVS